ncbi:MAG TPA: hypothetical protein VIG05_07960, partial [Candidatus Nitrosotenuis sp.]
MNHNKIIAFLLIGVLLLGIIPLPDVMAQQSDAAAKKADDIKKAAENVARKIADDAAKQAAADAAKQASDIKKAEDAARKIVDDAATQAAVNNELRNNGNNNDDDNNNGNNNDDDNNNGNNGQDDKDKDKETVFTGVGIPSQNLGKNGNIYINTANADVYLKISGSWILIGNLTGATGPVGPVGP